MFRQTALSTEPGVLASERNFLIQVGGGVMAKTVADVMTRDPVALDGKEPVTKAAAAMRDHGIGTVVVMTDGKPCGVVTDRDIAVKAVATGRERPKKALAQAGTKG